MIYALYMVVLLADKLVYSIWTYRGLTVDLRNSEIRKKSDNEKEYHCTFSEDTKAC